MKDPPYSLVPIFFSRESFPKVTVFMDEQSQNAHCSIVSTLAGISIEINALHSSNAWLSIVVTPFGIMTDFKALSENMLAPIVVSVLGRIRFSTFVDS